MIYKFTVPGAPVGKARPRVFRDNAGQSRAVTPKETVVYENLVKQSYRLNRQLQGAIKAEIIVYYPIPKSVSNKKRQLMIEGKIWPTKKPDIDNIVKSILDSLNSIAFHDDSQVTKMVVEKIYGEQPRVEVVLEELQETNIQERLVE